MLNPPTQRHSNPGFRLKRLGTLAAFCCLLFSSSTPSALAADAASCPGITEPVFDVTLSLPVPGIISDLRFKLGDFVHTNDVILELDNQLEQLEMERRKCIMDNHKADWDSTRTVFEKSGSVSRDELLKKEADYKVSQAEYMEAQEQLRRRRLVAPGAGVLCEMKLKLGEACSPYEAMVRLVDTRQCYFISDIPAVASAKLKTGQRATLEIENADLPIKVTGRIIFISPVVDPASGLQTVKVVFDNTDGKVRPGLAGKILLPEVPP